MSVPTTENYPVQNVGFTQQAGAPGTSGEQPYFNVTAPGVTLPAPGVIPQLADAAAPNCAVFWSTTQTALVFKDISGTVHLITVTSLG